MRSRIVIAGLLATLVLSACGESLEGKFDGDLFRAGCARCHADDGSGGIGPAIGTADSNAALVLTDEQIRGTVLVGPGRMPSFDRLTSAQIDSLIAYLRDLQTGRVVIDD